MGRRGQGVALALMMSCWFAGDATAVQDTAGIRGPTVGFKFGPSVATVSGDNIRAGKRVGFHLGLYHEMRYSDHFSFVVEGVFVREGAVSVDDDATMSLSYFKIPVLAKVPLLRGNRRLSPFVVAGAGMGFETRGKRGIPRMDFSLMFGGGTSVTLGSHTFLLDAVYSHGMTKVGEPPFVDANLAAGTGRFFGGRPFSNRVLAVSVGMSFRVSSGIIRMRRPGDVDESRPTTGSADVISRDEILSTGVPTVFDVVQLLHPNWLRGRVRRTLEQEAVEVVVYVNNSRRGGVDALRLMVVADVSEIEFINGRNATLRYGSNHGAGVIRVIVGRL